MKLTLWVSSDCFAAPPTVQLYSCLHSSLFELLEVKFSFMSSATGSAALIFRRCGFIFGMVKVLHFRFWLEFNTKLQIYTARVWFLVISILRKSEKLLSESVSSTNKVASIKGFCQLALKMFLNYQVLSWYDIKYRSDTRQIWISDYIGLCKISDVKAPIKSSPVLLDIGIVSRVKI